MSERDMSEEFLLLLLLLERNIYNRGRANTITKFSMPFYGVVYSEQFLPEYILSYSYSSSTKFHVTSEEFHAWSTSKLED